MGRRILQTMQPHLQIQRLGPSQFVPSPFRLVLIEGSGIKILAYGKDRQQIESLAAEQSLRLGIPLKRSTRRKPKGVYARSAVA